MSLIKLDGWRAANSRTAARDSYITGLQGILAAQSILWVFLSTFVPTLVSPDIPGHKYQEVLRRIFQVPFWDYSLISSFFIVLSMRTICTRFLRDPTSEQYAGALIRRIVRFTLLVSTASALATSIFAAIGPGFIDEFKSALPNPVIEAPKSTRKPLVIFNSLFNLFWLTQGFATQAANAFWPSSTLWVPAVIYYQGWTVYILMVFLPFTRPAWHSKALLLFAIGSFWYASWGWYSATGIFLAELAINPHLRGRLEAGLALPKHVGSLRIPAWLIGSVMTLAGLAIKYCFVVFPQYKNSMLDLHPFLDLSENVTKSDYLQGGPYPRLDDWLVIVGLMILVESSRLLQRILSASWLVSVGKRAFALFVAQSVVFWTAGVQLWLFVCVQHGVSTAAANAVVLVVCLPGTIIFAELFYWVVDVPSRHAAAFTFGWLRR